MGDARSRVYEAECDWGAFCTDNNFTIKADYYSSVATYAYRAKDMGLSGKMIEKYVEAVLKADKLRKEADELLLPFIKLSEVLKEINN